MDNSENTKKSTGLYAVIKNRNFVLLWLALIISAVGDRFNQMAILAQAPKESAGSYMALITFFSMLPYLVFSIFAGYLIDRFNRRYLLLISDIGRAVLVFGLLILPLYGSIYPVLPILFGLGCFAAVFSPAKSAMVPNIVSRDNLLAANSLISSAGLISFLVGGVIAGIFIKTFGFTPAIILDSFTFLASLALVFFIAAPQKNRKKEVKPNFLKEVKKGLVYIHRRPLVQTFIIFEVLFWFSAAMFYVVSTQFIYTYVSADIALYGIMMAALGGGMLSGGLAMGKLGDRLSLRHTYPRLTLLLGAAILLYSSVTTAGLAMHMMIISGSLLFLAGFAAGAFLIPISYSLQRIVADHLLGRVFSAKWMLSMLVYLGVTLLSKYLLDKIPGQNAPAIILFGLGGLLIITSFYLYILSAAREKSFLGGINTVWYHSLRLLGLFCCKIFFLFRTKGAGNVPREGAVVVVSNHASYLDPIFLGIACPRRLHFMMTDRFYNTKARPFFASVRAISIKESGGNTAALRAGKHVLLMDRALALFPEGQLSLDGKMQELQPGAAAIACRSNAWIQPAYIEGNFGTWTKGRRYPLPGRVTIRFGKPFKPVIVEDSRRESVRQTTAKIEQAIHTLRDKKD